MEWVNITAKSLPEAIDLALDNLGVDEAEAEIVVIEEPRQGLFGRMRGTARVKARVKPKATRPKVERNRNRKRRSEGGGRSGGRGGRAESRNKSSESASGGDEAQPAAATSSDSSGSSKSAASDRGRKSGRDGRRGDGRGRSERPTKREPRKEQAPVEEATKEEVSAHLQSFLGGLTEAFGFEGPAEVVPDDDDGVIVQVPGRHGLMVGPKGRTLESIQELARVSAQRTTPSNVRIKVDVGGYRQMRKEALQKFAVEAAEAAVADGAERSLEPMSAADRKIVHDALGEVDGVETRSAGNEPRRRVVIVPSVDVEETSADPEPIDESADSNGVVDAAPVDDGDAVGSE